MVMRMEASSPIRVDRGQLVKAVTGHWPWRSFRRCTTGADSSCGCRRPSGVAALRTVVVVRDTTKHVRRSTRGGRLSCRRAGLVKGLLRNYKLKENLAKAPHPTAERQAGAGE